MYESYFGLNKTPFLTTPDPGLHLLTAKHREALAALSHAIIVRKGLAVLCGEAGTGKTTLVRKLMQVSESVRAHTSVILNPILTPAEFLEMLLVNFGVTQVPTSKTQRLVMLEGMLRKAAEQRQTAVLIVDEAHTLSPEMLEEIRLLTNFETSNDKLIQVILAGHPDLNDMLNRQQFWHIKQRVAVRVEVGSLSLAELQQYITYRWSKSCDQIKPAPFTPEAIVRVAHWSRGIPRLINVICDNALVLAFANGIQILDSSHIETVAHDLDLRTSGFADADAPPSVSPKLIELITQQDTPPEQPRIAEPTLVAPTLVAPTAAVRPESAASTPASTRELTLGLVSVHRSAAPLSTAVLEPIGMGTLDRYSRDAQKTSLSRRWATWLKG